MFLKYEEKKKGFETYMPPDEEHITHEAVITKSGGGGKDLNWDKWKHIKKKKTKKQKKLSRNSKLV